MDVMVIKKQIKKRLNKIHMNIMFIMKTLIGDLMSGLEGTGCDHWMRM